MLFITAKIYSRQPIVTALPGQLPVVVDMGLVDAVICDEKRHLAKLTITNATVAKHSALRFQTVDNIC